MKLILTREVAGLGRARRHRRGRVTATAATSSLPRGAAIAWHQGRREADRHDQARPLTPARSATPATPARSRPALEKLTVPLAARAGRDGPAVRLRHLRRRRRGRQGRRRPDRRQAFHPTPATSRSVGSHTVTVKLHPGVTAKVSLVVKAA